MKITGGPLLSSVEVLGSVENRVADIRISADYPGREDVENSLFSRTDVFLDELDVVAIVKGARYSVRIRSDGPSDGQNYLHVANKRLTDVLHLSSGKKIPHTGFSIFTEGLQLRARLKINEAWLGKHGFVSAEELKMPETIGIEAVA